jgi:molybdate transport system substrate-binding protein
VRADNVRAALAFVARGEAPLGIVYETDARAEARVAVVGAFPPETHPPIVYPVAATTHAHEGGAGFVTFLRSRESQAIFERYGFSVIGEGSD